MNERPRSKRERIFGIIDDMISDFLYYDRKEDKDLPRGAIDELVKKGEISVEEMVAKFDASLRLGLL